MGLSRVRELVSQAEKEGVSLGVMISKKMTPEEMDLAQAELMTELEANHSSICDFMSDVAVPSIDEILSNPDLRARSPAYFSSDEFANKAF